MQFVGQLGRSALSKFWNLQHVGVFSSIYPEAFWHRCCRALASGAAIVTSAVGGAGELVPTERYGVRFLPGEAGSLARMLKILLRILNCFSVLRKRVRCWFALNLMFWNLYDSLKICLVSVELTLKWFVLITEAFMRFHSLATPVNSYALETLARSGDLTEYLRSIHYLALDVQPNLDCFCSACAGAFDGRSWPSHLGSCAS